MGYTVVRTLVSAVPTDDPNGFPTPEPSEPTDSGLMRDILARTREVSQRIVERVRQVSSEFDSGADGTPLSPAQPN
jgi:hypothetical protein